MEVIIKPNNSWIKLPWKEIWQYKDLVYCLVRRDIVARYKQTILGPLWYMFSPLTMVVTFFFFAEVANIETDGVPKMLFYTATMLIWTYINSLLAMTGSCFIANAALFTKVYFPRVIIPISYVVVNLFTLLLQTVPLVAFWFYYKSVPETKELFQLHEQWYLLPLVIVQSAILAMGIGMWFAALSTKYRDLQQLVNIIMRMLMYVSPVMYPLSLMSETMQRFAAWNPFVFPLEAFRILLFDRGTMSWELAMPSLIISIVCLVTGFLIFSRTERTFADTI